MCCIFNSETIQNIFVQQYEDSSMKMTSLCRVSQKTKGSTAFAFYLFHFFLNLLLDFFERIAATHAAR